MRESKIERQLGLWANSQGGVALKLAYTANGLPDRMVLLPGGLIAFVELKAPGKKPSSIQSYWIERLIGMGFKAGWADGIEEAKGVMTNDAV